MLIADLKEISSITNSYLQLPLLLRKWVNLLVVKIRFFNLQQVNAKQHRGVLFVASRPDE
uniref:Uncharacterized protein n=1 Tax=Anguilla anguilla TaxID=7936 RepID=A0A0E9RYA6_ANGAN